MLAPSDGLPQAQTDLVLTAVDLSVAAADEATHGNYETAFELLSCAQRGVECIKAFGTQAFNEASLPIVETYMQYRHPGFDWHTHYAKESQEQIAQHSDPAVQKAAQFGSAVGKALPHALLTLLSAKTGPGASHPPAAMAPQAAAAGINGATVTVTVAAADGVTVAAQAAKVTAALMTDGPQDTNTAGSGQQAPVPQAPAQDKPAMPNSTSKAKIEFFENNIKHIFRDAEGHLQDTIGNRQAILDLANDPKNYYSSPDAHGNLWCARILEDGTQIWASIRDGKIRNAGLNKTPIKWDCTTGLCSFTKK